MSETSELAALAVDGKTKLTHSSHRVDNEDKFNDVAGKIGVNGILGAGLYTGSGEMLKYAGPGAVVTCYALIGFLTVCVMQCIGEMLCIWPLPNALVQYVSSFVDPELGTVVGLCYWFAWTTSFQALISAAALEGAYWFGSPINAGAGQIFALYVAPQAVLLSINALPVEVYGVLEIVGGAVKAILIIVVIVFLGIINGGFGKIPGRIGQSNFSPPFQHAPGIHNEITAVFMAMAPCAYSFLGAEIPAVTATEATLSVRASPARGTNSSRIANKSLFFSVACLPAIVVVIYLVAGVLASMDLDPGNYSSLPGSPWLSQRSSIPGDGGFGSITNSSATVFVIIAHETGEAWLETMFTAFFVFTAWSAANTSLYVSSRTLYGLTAPLVEQPGSLHSDAKSTLSRCFGWMAHTTHPAKVPFYAAFFNIVISFWIPYLPIWSKRDQIAASTILEVLQRLAAVFGVIVWACECLAYINFRKYSIKFERELLKESHLAYLLRSRSIASSEFPWYSIGQPWTAYFALLGCIVVLVASGAAAWNPNSWTSDAAKASAAAAIVGGYGPPLIMAALWVALKWAKYGRSFRDWRQERVKFWDTGYFITVNALDQQRKQAIENSLRTNNQLV